MKVTVIGLGAIGGWLAGRLALGGHQVQAVARGATAEALRHGLAVTEGGVERTAPVKVADGCSEPQHLLLLATKAVDLADAAERAGPYIGPETLILPLQNGVPWWFAGGEPLRCVDPEGRIGRALPQDRVIGGVVHAACRRVAPAGVEVVHADRLILGEPGGGESKRVAGLAEAFRAAGVPAEGNPDVRRAIWYKLWGNMTINPISATTGLTADRILAHGGHRQEIMEAMEEARAVGAAIGCPIEESAEARLGVTARLGAFKTSMLQDVEAGRRIELDALVGAVAEIARRAGVPTPTIDRIERRTRAFATARKLL